ncbi:MAG: hypothetical protein IE886_06895 [Campylobacterales bacterium]|nr:hypothetical protein [Campylobacterales bacterium]
MFPYIDYIKIDASATDNDLLPTIVDRFKGKQLIAERVEIDELGLEPEVLRRCFSSETAFPPNSSSTPSAMVIFPCQMPASEASAALRKTVFSTPRAITLPWWRGTIC